MKTKLTIYEKPETQAINFLFEVHRDLADGGFARRVYDRAAILAAHIIVKEFLKTANLEEIKKSVAAEAARLVAERLIIKPEDNEDER